MSRFAPLSTDQLVRAALAEDLGTGDVTTRLTVMPGKLARAQLVARAPTVLAGISVCRKVFRAVDCRVLLVAHCRDGTRINEGQIVATVSGPACSLLSAERTALNFVQHLSGIATLTRRFVDCVRKTGATILDTRKTTPGWRELEKYAVRCGGGANHRRGLYDMVLIKDNHIAAAGSITETLDRCRRAKLPVEVEARTLAEVREALAAGAARILLDNMTPAMMKRAVGLCRGRAKTEASGGVTLRNVRQVALTGVDYISVGALTHSAPAADIALDFLK